MKTETFIAGTLVLLLLFGCTMPKGGGASSSAQQPSGAGQLAQGIGDADIDVMQVTNDSDLLPATEPVEADAGVISNASDSSS